MDPRIQIPDPYHNVMDPQHCLNGSPCNRRQPVLKVREYLRHEACFSTSSRVHIVYRTDRSPTTSGQRKIPPTHPPTHPPTKLIPPTHLLGRSCWKQHPDRGVGVVQLSSSPLPFLLLYPLILSGSQPLAFVPFPLFLIILCM